MTDAATRPQPQVVRTESADELADVTAQRALGLLAAAVADRGVAHLVVTGGSILEAVLTAMAAPTDPTDPTGPLDWSAVHVWWGDERYVASDSDDRNDRPARAALFDKVPVDPAKIHPMPASDVGFADAEAAAAAYDAALVEAGGGTVPAFDVCLLGIGPDGHTCSLFPDHPGTRRLDTAVIAVHESPKPPPDRLSLSFTGLAAAREIWFIASGDGKADAVARALGGAPREQVPSAGPRGSVATYWLIDEAAAGRL